MTPLPVPRRLPWYYAGLVINICSLCFVAVYGRALIVFSQ
jgi:hypothetical protein